MRTNNLLESFGKAVIENLRDTSIEEYLSIKSGQMTSADARDIHQTYLSTNPTDRDKIDKIVFNMIDRILHNALVLFEQSADFTITGKAAIASEADIVEMSDGLSGELYTDDGWIKKYSNFPPGTLEG